MKKETIDFTGVTEGGGARHIKPGNYLFKIVSVEKKWKDNDKSNVPYYAWKLQIVEGTNKGWGKNYTTSLKAEALFNLRNLIHAATGKEVAGKRLAFDPSSLVGKTIGGTVEDGEWKNKVTSDITDVFPKENLKEDDDSDEEDEEDEDEDSDDEESDEDDLEEVDLDEV